MIIIKEKVKDFPTLIFLMIFDFWAGTVWSSCNHDIHYNFTFPLSWNLFQIDFSAFHEHKIKLKQHKSNKTRLLFFPTCPHRFLFYSQWAFWTMFEKLQDWYRRDIPYSQWLSLAQGRLEGSWSNSLEKVDVRQSSNNQLGISRWRGWWRWWG